MLEGSSTWRNSGSGSGVNSSRMSKLHLRAPRRGVGVGSAAWAGPHGRAAACHWAPSARAARAECIAQPSSREPQPRDRRAVAPPRRRVGQAAALCREGGAVRVVRLLLQLDAARLRVLVLPPRLGHARQALPRAQAQVLLRARGAAASDARRCSMHGAVACTGRHARGGSSLGDEAGLQPLMQRAAPSGTWCAGVGVQPLSSQCRGRALQCLHCTAAPHSCILMVLWCMAWRAWPALVAMYTPCS